MEKLLVILALVCANSALASGKLSYQLNAYEQGQSYGSMFGLNVYEKINSWSALNTWAGMGDQPRDISEDVSWYMAKAQLDLYMGNFTVAPGLQYKYVLPYEEDQVSGYVRIDYKVW